MFDLMRKSEPPLFEIALVLARLHNAGQVHHRESRHDVRN
jgi:hypothetical protein